MALLHLELASGLDGLVADDFDVGACVPHLISLLAVPADGGMCWRMVSEGLSYSVGASRGGGSEHQRHDSTYSPLRWAGTRSWSLINTGGTSP